MSAATKRNMWDYAPSGLLGASALVGAYGDLQAGSYAKTASALNARMSRMSAATARQQAGMAADAESYAGSMEEKAFRRKGSKLLASNRAAIGASGFGFGGSTIDAMADTAAQLELEALTKRWESQTRVDQLRYSGELQAWQAEQEAALQEWQGGIAKRGSYLKAFGALLGGAGGVMKAWPGVGGSGYVSGPWDQMEY